MDSRPHQTSSRARQVLIISASCVAGAAAVGWLIFLLAQYVFLPNHIRYQINQRQYGKALKKAERLESRSGNRPRLNALQTQALVLSGDTGAAIKIGQTAAEKAELGAEGFYWLAMACYQAGLKAEAGAHAAEFLREKITLPNGADKLARALAGETEKLERPDIASVPFRMMFPLEQAVYMGFAAQQYLAEGNAAAAAALSRGTFVRGNRNPQLLQDGALACVLAGDVDGAQLCLSVAQTSVAALLPRLAQLREKRQGAGVPQVSVYATAAAGGISSIDLARAEAWVLAQAAGEAGTMDEDTYQALQSLQTQYPDDVAIRVSLARAREMTGDAEAARAIYMAVQETHSSLELWLKLHAAGADAAVLASRAGAFLDSLNPLAILLPGQWRIETEKSADEDSSPTHQFVTNYQIPQAGAYRLALILRGTQTLPAGALYMQTSAEGEWDAAVFSGQQWQVCQYQIDAAAGSLELSLSTAPPFVTSSMAGLPEIAAILVLPVPQEL